MAAWWPMTLEPTEDAPMKQTLEERISAALTEDVTSAAVGELLLEIEGAIPAAQEAAKAARAKVLDPRMPVDAKARAAVEEAALALDRLQSALPALQMRAQETYRAEELTRWLPRHEAAKVRRDAVAAKLCELYPALINELVPLLLEAEAADAEVRQVNCAAPQDGGRHLCSVEEQARGSEAGKFNNLTLIKDLRLPTWVPSQLAIWPPHRPMDPHLISPLPAGGDPRLYTDRWWEVGRVAAGREAAG
jgi:hypothetical protein